MVYTQNEWYQEWFSAYRRDYISSAVDQIFAGPNEGKTNDGSASEGGRMGYVGRLKYDYKGKYILEGNFRYDGSDNFPEDSRWGFFPSVSAGWVVSDESFMKKLDDKDILNLLKIRASYGTVGNDDVARFAYVPSYSLVQGSLNVDGNLLNGFSEGNLVSPDLTWFTQKSQNYGFDFGTLNNKLSGSFDYFYYKTSGFLISPLDRYITPLGKSLPVVKSNSVLRRAGLEFVLQYKGRLGDLKYEVGTNLTKYDQLWEQKDDEDEVSLKNPLRRLTHQTDYFGHGLRADGLYQSLDEVMNSPRTLGGTGLAPGDIRYEDVNGDGKIDQNDEVRVGKSTFPHLNYGFDIKLDYKGFSLYSLIQGTGARNMYLSDHLQNRYSGLLHYDFQLDYWKDDNTNATFPRLSSIDGLNGGHNQKASTWWLVDAAYVRLKSLSLSYDLRYSLLKNQNVISSCRLSINGTNLLTFSNAKKYFDPENGSSAGYAYPMQRVWSIGLNVGF